MVQGKWFAPGTNPGAAADVRQEVFGFGQDALDSMSWNVLVYQDDVPAASGRIWWEDGAYRLGEIGVLPALRGRRLGDLTFRLLLFKAQEHFAREVRLAAPPEVTGFFTPRGGISIYPYANYGRPGTRYAELAMQRFANHE